MEHCTCSDAQEYPDPKRDAVPDGVDDGNVVNAQRVLEGLQPQALQLLHP